MNCEQSVLISDPAKMIVHHTEAIDTRWTGDRPQCLESSST